MLIATQPGSPPTSAALATASAVGGIGFGNFPEYCFQLAYMVNISGIKLQMKIGSRISFAAKLPITERIAQRNHVYPLVLPNNDLGVTQAWLSSRAAPCWSFHVQDFPPLDQPSTLPDTETRTLPSQSKVPGQGGVYFRRVSSGGGVFVFGELSNHSLLPAVIVHGEVQLRFGIIPPRS